MGETMFQNMVFHLHGLNATDRDWLISMVPAFGGQLCKKIGAKTTHVLVDSDTVSESLAKWITPFPSVIVLKHSFINDSLYNQALVNRSRYTVQRPQAPANTDAAAPLAANRGKAAPMHVKPSLSNDTDSTTGQQQLMYIVDEEDGDDDYVFPVPKKRKLKDVEEPTASPRSISLPSDANDDRPVCPFDPNCYRKNPQHFEEYSHPKRDMHTSRTAVANTTVTLASPAKVVAPTGTMATKLTTLVPMASPESASANAAASAPAGSFTMPTWSHKGTLYVLTGHSVKPSAKIAAFDMDSTLIETKSGNKFAKDRNDWRWMLPEIKPKLAEFYKKGYKIVIFTNQAGAGNSKEKLNALSSKILDIAKNLGIPFQAFMASAKDVWRKPNTLMWDELCENYNSGVKVNYTDSFYVGDAAGRPAGWKPGAKKDFSPADRMFAYNVGLTFHTPEEFFLGEDKANFSWGSIDPAELVQKLERAKTKPFTAPVISSSAQEIIVMVGFPASGKSSFVKNYLVPKGYERVNRDALGTQDKCVSAAASALANGQSVAVDNTCPDVATRAKYIELAKKFKVKIRCFVMQTSLELAHHLNQFREKVTKGVVKRIPDIAYNTYRSKFTAPSLGEGFSEIVPITWVPQFTDDSHRRLFLQFTES